MDLQLESETERLSERRFLVLLRNLPPNSAFGLFLSDKSNRDLVDRSME